MLVRSDDPQLAAELRAAYPQSSEEIRDGAPLCITDGRLRSFVRQDGTRWTGQHRSDGMVEFA